MQKQRFQNQQQRQSRQQQQITPLENDFAPDASIDAAVVTEEKFPEKPSYLKYTFANPYNLTLLGGALLASALTLNPFIGIAALGLEGLWLLHGSQSRFMQRMLWDPMYEKERLEFEQRKRMEQVQKLSRGGQQRVMQLIEKEKQIQQLAMQNPSFTGDLLRGEIAKTHNLVNAYIDLAVTCWRYENYLSSIDVQQLENTRRHWQSLIETSQDKADALELDLAKKNLAIIDKRIERVAEIRRYLKIAYGQINLIENSFQLLADQIVTMQSPSELSGQLDELLDGVESIKETAKETEQILKTL
ncbi:MAG TPA: hypothetical protein VK400_04455 [Pyrinomonadaceae bacterium]|nr:hypothetical protein [Pyrinomonadaceae bacterium]